MELTDVNFFNISKETTHINSYYLSQSQFFREVKKSQYPHYFLGKYNGERWKTLEFVYCFIA